MLHPRKWHMSTPSYNQQHGKLYVCNNTFYSVHSKIRVNWPVIKWKCKGKILLSKASYIDIFIKKQVMNFLKLYNSWIL